MLKCFNMSQVQPSKPGALDGSCLKKATAFSKEIGGN